MAPTFQPIHLNIDPDNPAYTGTTTIDVIVKKTTNKIGFYQQDLTVNSARLVSGHHYSPFCVYWRLRYKLGESAKRDSVMKLLNTLAKDDDPAVIRAAVDVLEEFDY